MWLMVDEGLTLSLDALLATVYSGAEVLLYTTFHEPVAGDTLATFEAIEASWTGYARQSPEPWDAASVGGDGRAFSYSALLTFPVTSVGAGTIVYGYCLILSPNDIWAEQLDNRPVPSAGVPVTFKVRLSLGNLAVA